MKKIRVLTEIDLPDLSQKEYDVVKLDYGNRLLSYLFQNHNEKLLLEYLKEEFEVVVCCRASAIFLAQHECKGLRFIQLTSTGFDRVPVDLFYEKGIFVSNLPGVYNVSIAETVLYGIMCYYKRFRKSPQSFKPVITRHYSHIEELRGKTAIILGAGKIGTEIAKLLCGIGISVDGYARTDRKEDPYKTIICTRDELVHKLPNYNIVISTLPYTVDTHHFCDSEFFDCMKEDGIFFNIGRADTVDENSLYSHLKNDQIGGCIFDTVELFPFWPANRFRRLKNTLVLPGIATSSKECKTNVVAQITKNITEYGANGTCKNSIKSV